MNNNLDNTINNNDLKCGLVIVKPVCEIRPNLDNEGMGFFINDVRVLRTLGYTPNVDLLIIKNALDAAYKIGYSDASTFLMNRDKE